MIRTWITTDSLEPARMLDGFATADDGAVITFAGTVRRHNGGRVVTGMRYDAYREMAERELDEIARETAARWPVTRIAAAHRVGELAIGEVSVMVSVASPHRAEAFDAARNIIEEIKRRLPVWKQEHYTDGSRWLDGNVQPVPEATTRE